MVLLPAGIAAKRRPRLKSNRDAHHPHVSKSDQSRNTQRRLSSSVDLQKRTGQTFILLTGLKVLLQFKSGCCCVF